MKRGELLAQASLRTIDSWFRYVGSIAQVYFYIIAFIFIAIHFGIVWKNCFHNFPSYDEVGYLPAGICHWEYSSFDYYKVNPPLVRMIAAFPAWIRGDAVAFNWVDYRIPPHFRPEFIVGVEQLKERGLMYQKCFILPRIFTSVFSLISIALILQAFGKLVGRMGAMLCAILWMSSPEILAHASSIGPDVASATVGIALSISALTYVKSPTFRNAIFIGVVLGISLITKYTWLTALLSLPCTIMLCERFCFHRPLRVRWQYWTRDFLIMFTIATIVINVSYGFEGTFQFLGAFRFQSASMSGTISSYGMTGNRFEESIFGKVPVPLPKNYVLGIDFLKWESEQNYWSFLHGEWKPGAWSYFYFFTVLYKTPLPLLIGSSLGLVVFLVGWARRIAEPELVSLVLLLAIPAVACFIAISSNCGFSHHHRYVIMIYPPMFLLASFLGSPTTKGILSIYSARNNDAQASKIGNNGFFAHWTEIVGIVFVLFSVISGLRIHPHYLSYFNSIAGGPDNGWKHLGASCVDFGQDIPLVKKWIDSHPDCRPLAFQLDYVQIGGELFDLPSRSIPTLPSGAPSNLIRVDETEWWIVNVKRLYNKPDYPGLQYLQQLTPVDKIGYAYHVYRIEARDRPDK